MGQRAVEQSRRRGSPFKCGGPRDVGSLNLYSRSAISLSPVCHVLCVCDCDPRPFTKTYTLSQTPGLYLWPKPSGQFLSNLVPSLTILGQVFVASYADGDE